MIVFTAISGAQNEEALCYLVEIEGNVKIMLDCGWNDHFDLEDLKHLRRVSKQVDVLLLSHPDLAHLGAFPYAYGNFGLTCPVYATVPVVHMGRMCMYDCYQSKANEEEFDTFALDNVDAAFEKVTQLKYSQPTALTGKCQGITITAYSAGHTIGGTLWKIKKDTEEIVYAVDYNHKKEKHLDGTVLHLNGEVLEALSRPSLMITDAYNSLIVHPPRKFRDNALFETIIKTLQNEGNVLIPTDSSARVLELAYLLDQHWAANHISYPLILMTHQSYRTLQYAKSMLEWMGDAINRQFDTSRENPFEFRYLRLCHRYKDLTKYPGLKVVLASNVSLETGYARELFLEWGTDKRNVLILTDRGPPNSLARYLYMNWEELASSQPAVDTLASAAQQSQQPVIKPAVYFNKTMNFVIRKKIPLEGAELVEYNAERRTRLEREAAEAALRAKSKMIIEDDESDHSESDEVDDDDMEELLSTQFDLYIKDATKSGGFFKQTQSYRMFPYVEKRKRFDEYGETLQTDGFLKSNERDDPNYSSESDVPTKYVSYNQDVELQCQIRFIDFEGTNDGRSIKTIVPQIQPRKLIIIHASPDATADFKQSCLAIESMTRDIYTPAIGEILNVSAEIKFYPVKLTDALVSSLKFSKLDDYDLAYVTGKIHIPLDSDVAVLDVDKSEQANIRQPVFVGEVKLTELKRVLQTEGITAEFKGEGVLVCNERVAVRKTTAGEIILEGSLSEDYYKILTNKWHAAANIDPLTFDPPIEQITLPTVDTSKHSNALTEEEQKTVILNRELLKLTRAGTFPDIFLLCQDMKNRGIKPNTRTYNLILQVYQREGLFQECTGLLHEMIENGIPPDLETFNHVLLSTSFAQTGIYREHVWSLLEKHNLIPSPLTYEHYLEGFIVLEELEHALDVLDEMTERRFIKPTARTFWQIMKLAIALNEVDLAFETLLKLEKYYKYVLPTIYMEVMRCCAFHFHIEGILYCWKKTVDDANLIPDQGICLSIINAAARNGNPDLATTVIKSLVAKRVKIEEEHFAALLAAYVAAGDLKRAFNVLRLARDSGAEPNCATAFPITNLIRNDGEKIDKACNTLKELHSNGRKIDVAALNAIIKACHYAKYNQENRSHGADIDRAVKIYNQAETLNIMPNAETFEMLMQCCLTINQRSLGQQYFEEMRRRGIDPSPRIFTTMIQLVCTDADYEDAFTLLEEIKSRDILPPITAYEAIVSKCARHRDPRATIALEEMQTVGYSPSPELVKFVRTGTMPKTNNNRKVPYTRQETTSTENTNREPNIPENPELDRLQAALDDLDGDSNFNIPNLNQGDMSQLISDMVPTVLLLKDKNNESINMPELSTLLKNGPDTSKIWGIVVTSQRAVKALVEAWKAAENDISHEIQIKWKSLPFFVVGNMTASIATRDLGFTPIGAKESGNAELLADFIVDFYTNNKDNNATEIFTSSLLFLVGDKHLDTLVNKLKPTGINLRELTVYESTSIPDFTRELQNTYDNDGLNTNQVKEKRIPFNWVVFFSPSGVDLALPALKNLRFWKWIKVAAIGPTTKEHLIMNKSINVSAVSPKPDSQSLAKAIFEYDSSSSSA
ncbi:6099_t:CDS:10, partial [Ambispora leptoticha]